MPLSDEEQRILHEMEQHLYQEDREFADRVRTETVYRHAGRNCVWSALAFVLGVAAVVFFLEHSIWVSFVGFAVMVVSLLYFERNLRRMGRAGWYDVTRSMRDHGIADAMAEARQRLRDRFHRPT